MPMMLAGQALRFLVVGLINTGLTLGVIYLLVSGCQLPYYTANATGFTIGFLNSFFMNRFWTFNSRGHMAVEGVWFVLVFLVSYLTQLACFAFMTRVAGFSIPVAQLVAMGIYTGVNFSGNRWITFAKRRR